MSTTSPVTPTTPVVTARRRSIPLPSGVWGLLVALLVFGAVVRPEFATTANLNSILVSTGPLVLLALGQTFVMLGREIDLSVGSVLGLSAIICGRYLNDDPGRIIPVLILVMAVGAAVGAINGLITQLLSVPSFVVTLGMLLVVRGFINVWTGGAPSSNIPSELSVWLTGTQIAGFATGTLTILVVMGGAAYVLAHRTKFGRTLTLTGSNPRAAELAGLPSSRAVVVSFVLSGVFAAVAGFYTAAWTGSVRGDLGTGFELIAIASAVLGGVALTGGGGSMLSALAGALSLGLLLNLLIVMGLPVEAQNVVKGLVIIVAVLAYKRLPSIRSFRRSPRHA